MPGKKLINIQGAEWMLCLKSFIEKSAFVKRFTLSGKQINSADFHLMKIAG